MKVRDRSQVRTTYLGGWSLYPVEALNHHMQGFWMAVITLLSDSIGWIVFASLWTLLYIAYQGLSLVRKRDSAGLDVMDFMVGALIGLILIVTLEFFGWPVPSLST